MENKDPDYFISAEAALKKIYRTVKKSDPVVKKVSEAVGCVLAETIKSKVYSPPFDQSAMDGYAIRFSDVKPGTVLKVNGQVAAGSAFGGRMKKGEAVRIFTGAQVPAGADTVIMQEHTRLEGNRLFIVKMPLRRGHNIRKRGSQIRKGQQAIKSGTLLNPGAIGFLSSMGISKIKVFRKPVVGVLVTGDELTIPGKPLRPGHIYESNSSMIRSALESEGIRETIVRFSGDNHHELQKSVRAMLRSCNILIITGGISVGTYDFTGRVLNEEKVKCVFYKVKQKPGKPVYFGIKGKKYVFGLPGNPASVLTCFKEYVVPVIRGCMDHPVKHVERVFVPSAQDIVKKPGLTVFLKGKLDKGEAVLLKGQESYILKSFVDATGLIVLREEVTLIKKGDMVDFHKF